MRLSRCWQTILDCCWSICGICQAHSSITGTASCSAPGKCNALSYPKVWSDMLKIDHLLSRPTIFEPVICPAPSQHTDAQSSIKSCLRTLSIAMNMLVLSLPFITDYTYNRDMLRALGGSGNRDKLPFEIQHHLQRAKPPTMTRHQSRGARYRHVFGAQRSSLPLPS